MTKVYAKDIRDFKTSLKVTPGSESTRIITVAIHKDPAKNRKIKVGCVGCMPFHGYRYNSLSDTYSIVCHDYLDIGMIGISYKVGIRGAGGWEVGVPMPSAVIRRYLDHGQRLALRGFQLSYKDMQMSDEITFDFVQMQSAY